jgi:hypothetical protein
MMRRGFDPFRPPWDNARRLRENFSRLRNGSYPSTADTWEDIERSMVESGVMRQLIEQKRMTDQFRQRIGIR